jgi:hypothetical protein
MPSSAETELLMLLSCRALSSAAIACVASTVAAAFTSTLAAASSAIASLAALVAVAAVSAAACSHSSAATTSASCRYCKLTASPFLARQMSKWFYDASTEAATGAARCGSFVGKVFSLLVVSSR